MPRKKSNPFGLFKPIFAIIVLSAFVLGISFIVKTVATSDFNSVVASLSPVLEKLNLNGTQFGKMAEEFASKEPQEPVQSTASAQTKINKEDINFGIALLADSHGAYDNLTKALDMSKEYRSQYVFFLGDYTDLGVIEDLQTAKTTMEAAKVDYASIPGDHDLWKSVGPQNFIDVFGKNYFSKSVNGIKFVGLDNSANYTVIDKEQMDWFKKEVANADFVLLSQPLYHPSNDRVMGVVNGQENKSVKFQANEIIGLIRNSKVKAIIAGDHHLATENKDPEKPALEHIVIGALAKERNLQSPRFSMLWILKDGDYAIEDILLK